MDAIKRLKKYTRRLGIEVLRWPTHLSPWGHLSLLFEELDPALVLDVGANEGQFGTRLRTEVGYKGRICSYEPTPSVYERLVERTSGDPLWDCERLAVGASSGTLSFELYQDSKWNSSRRVRDDVVEGTGRTSKHLETIEVRVARIEEVWPEVTGRVFLKSDTQGGELDVLKGLESRAEQVCGLLLEAPLRQFYEGEPLFSEIIVAAQGLGFHPSGFFPVSRARSSFKIDGLDIAFVR